MDKDVSSLLKEAVAEVLEEVRRVPVPAPTSHASGNRSDININAGGLAVWISATACIVVMALSVVGAIYLIRELGEQDRQLQELREKDQIHDAWLQTLNNNKQDKQK